MRKNLIASVLLLFITYPALAEPPRTLLDQPVFKATVVSELKSRWQFGLTSAQELNKLIQAPCFEYSKPYCMPKSTNDEGFVCSGQSAVIVTHLRSLGLKAAPFYLEWESAPGKVEAHAMVVVPFLQGNQLCHHFLEVARTWPHQPVVEFSYCEIGKPKTQKEREEGLRKAVREHFVNPPDHTSERKAADLPFRRGIPDTSPFTVRIVDKAFDLDDPYNSDAPIWTLDKGRMVCPQGLCTIHQVAKHIQIDQSKVIPDDRKSFSKTEIIVDYSDSQVYSCTQNCRAEDCVVKQTGRAAPIGLKVNWPPLRATCAEAAVLRSYLVNPAFSCRAQCETPRNDYAGGFYKVGVEELPMVCSPTPGAPLHHHVRKKDPPYPPADGSHVPNRTLRKN